MCIDTNDILITYDKTRNHKIVKDFQILWNEQNDYKCGCNEQGLIWLLNKFKNNTEFDEVLIKCRFINRIFSTRISNNDIEILASYISNENTDFDKRLAANDITLIDNLIKCDTKKHFFSFATKYCAMHKPVGFPIFDSISAAVLKYYQAKDNFTPAFNNLHDYKIYLNAYKDFIKNYDLKDFNYREIDKYLWCFGKKNNIQ